MALPELATIARSASSRPSALTATGAPTSAEATKRAADTVSASSDTSTPTSSPSGLIPAATPAERKPVGSPECSSSVTWWGRSTQRERKKVAWAAALT